MPNLYSAVKRMRVSAKARARNSSVRSELSFLRRLFMEFISAKNKDKINETYRQYCSALDKAAKKGVIKKQKAVRRKRRAAALIAKLA
jgi:small subunit ribosomal protein S20